MTKTFEQALYAFLNQLAAQTGDLNPVTKIGLSPKAFDAVVTAIAWRDPSRVSFEALAAGGIKIYDVEIVARPKDNF